MPNILKKIKPTLYMLKNERPKKGVDIQFWLPFQVSYLCLKFEFIISI